jgi:hypothetical protein
MKTPVGWTRRLQASQEAGFWQKLARFPRSEFAVDPAAVQVGKISPGARLEDFSTLGPAGTCSVRFMQALGR